MTTDAPGLREAAERLTQHNAATNDFDSPYYDVSSRRMNVSQLNRDTAKCAEAYLAAHPASEEPITESSLLSHGWEYDGGEVAFVRYVNDSDGEPQRLLFYGDRKLVIGSYAAKCKTMPQLLHLLAALGCESKGKVE